MAPDSSNPNSSNSVPPLSAADSLADTSSFAQTFVPGMATGAATPSSSKATPTAFGRYEVRKTLGEGSFGAVFLGHDTQLDRPVAIKVFRGGPEGPRVESDRLLNEARRLARLRHPGIVAVHDVGTQDGQVFIVSDFLDGQDLATWL